MIYVAKRTPIDGGTKSCTSDYKIRNKKRPTHNGMDLTGATRNIIAIDEGTVSSAGYGAKSGYYVYITHANGYKSFYCHLAKGSILVKKNQKVTSGQQIATMGKTGVATGVHLHFGVMNEKNVWIDPKPTLDDITSFEAKKDDKDTYEVISPRMIRTGPHTTYRIKKVSEISADGKKHVVNTKSTADAQYKKGTKFDVLEIAYAPNGAKWGRGYSGWICLVSSKGTVYCKKVK